VAWGKLQTHPQQIEMEIELEKEMAIRNAECDKYKAPQPGGYHK